jgi:hypothetical protein
MRGNDVQRWEPGGTGAAGPPRRVSGYWPARRWSGCRDACDEGPWGRVHPVVESAGAGTGEVIPFQAFPSGCAESFVQRIIEALNAKLRRTAGPCCRGVILLPGLRIGILAGRYPKKEAGASDGTRRLQRSYVLVLPAFQVQRQKADRNSSCPRVEPFSQHVVA